jgi:CTP:molybdopterin cytidylyltransferase MocA
MGTPKALMIVDGEPWWRQQAARLRTAPGAGSGGSGREAIWVVSDAVRAAMIRGPDAPANLVSGDPDRPMFASLLAGLEAIVDGSTGATARALGVFVLPIDVPAPRPSTWGAIEAAARSHADRAIVATYREQAGHPVLLPAPFIVQLRSDIRSGRIDAHTARLDHLIAPITRHLAVNDPAVVVNLNTPDDVRAYLAQAPV